MSIDAVSIETLKPIRCEWDEPLCDLPAKFSVSHPAFPFTYRLCGIHKRPMARWLDGEAKKEATRGGDACGPV